MRFYLIRHGIAEPHADGLPDEARALTERGWKRTRQAMRGLARVARLDLVVTSPLVRARETADLAARAFELEAPTVAPELSPGGDLDALLARLAAGKPPGDGDDDRSIAFVGHMPGLAELAAILASGRDEVALEIKRAGVVRLTGEPRRGGATLDWLLAPRHLRALRR